MTTLDPDSLRLGKQDHKHDPRTLKLMSIVDAAVLPDVPNTYDLAKGRAPMPRGLWGNDKWGDCVKVSKYNHAVRLARLDRRRTIKVTEAIVVDEYRGDTGSITPGDQRDTGLVMLDNFARWKNTQTTVPQGKKNVPFPIGIQAYGDIPTSRLDHMRACIYLLGGMEFGLSLPNTAGDQISQGKKWDDTGSSSSDAQPGSWGGHAVYSERYDQGGFYVITWGVEEYMTNAFVLRYADEAWAVVDKVEGKRYLNQTALDNYFKGLGTSNNG